MTGFITALAEHAFLRQAVLAGLLASVACGIVGTYVVTRRITVIAGSLAHTVLGGMGAAYYLRAAQGWQWLHPLHGAVAAALLGAGLIGLVRARSREREDTVISALWAVGMAVGVFFLFKTPGYKADLITYLFGNIVMVDPVALRLLIGLDLVILLLVLVFYNPLLAVCFDEEFARLRGVRVGWLYTLLLMLIALTIVTLVYVVGIVMVIALVTLPASVAGLFVRRLWPTMVLAAALSSVLTVAGLGISYGADLPAGATIVLLTGLVYATAQLAAGLGRRRP
ncbi:MAG: metal ABC transporter permease [bacterium]|nr:metal ABC transporter permease [bacterium]